MINKFSIIKKPVTKSFFFLIFLILYSLIGSRIIDAGNDYQNELSNETFYSMFWLFLLGSLIETLVLNLFLNFLFRKQRIIRLRNITIVILCSVFFGFAHFSSLKFFIITTIAGIVFNTNFYIYLKSHKNYIIASLFTFLLHFFSNFFTYLINNYLIS